jgi:septal ring factor EnvC (AmiA/AmiB activator)
MKAENEAREVRAVNRHKEMATQMATMKAELASLQGQVRLVKDELASVKTTVERIDATITQAAPGLAIMHKAFNRPADTEDSPAPDRQEHAPNLRGEMLDCTISHHRSLPWALIPL